MQVLGAFMKRKSVQRADPIMPSYRVSREGATRANHASIQQPINPLVHSKRKDLGTKATLSTERSITSIQEKVKPPTTNRFQDDHYNSMSLAELLEAKQKTARTQLQTNKKQREEDSNIIKTHKEDSSNELPAQDSLGSLVSSPENGSLPENDSASNPSMDSEFQDYELGEQVAKSKLVPPNKNNNKLYSELTNYPSQAQLQQSLLRMRYQYQKGLRGGINDRIDAIEFNRYRESYSLAKQSLNTQSMRRLETKRVMSEYRKITYGQRSNAMVGRLGEDSQPSYIKRESSLPALRKATFQSNDPEDSERQDQVQEIAPSLTSHLTIKRNKLASIPLVAYNKPPSNLCNTNSRVGLQAGQLLNSHGSSSHLLAGETETLNSPTKTLQKSPISLGSVTMKTPAVSSTTMKTPTVSSTTNSLSINYINTSPFSVSANSPSTLIQLSSSPSLQLESQLASYTEICANLRARGIKIAPEQLKRGLVNVREFENVSGASGIPNKLLMNVSN